MNRRLTLIALAASLLAGAQGFAVAQAAIDAPAQVVPAVDAATIAVTLAEVDDVEHWKKVLKEGDSKEMVNAFYRWTKTLTLMSRAGQKDDADRICAAIVEMHRHIPQDAMLTPSQHAANAFIRDRFRVGDVAVDAAQFFEPERYYKNDPSIMKLYRFSVYDGSVVVMRYFLEHSQLGDQDYYVLGKADPKTGAHYQVQPYGALQPNYWTLLRRALEDMGDPNPQYPVSSKPH